MCDALLRRVGDRVLVFVHDNFDKALGENERRRNGEVEAERVDHHL